MILKGGVVRESLDVRSKDYIMSRPAFFVDKYIAILLLSDDVASRAYVNLKQKKGIELGIRVDIVEKPNENDVKNVLDMIDEFNNDSNCLWIIVQLPLNESLTPHLATILAKIDVKKDIDGLWGALLGYSQIGYVNFLPATPRAVVEILKHYKIDTIWKKITIVGQSNLVGKPLAMELMKQGATIFSFNIYSDQDVMKKCCRRSDIIISATGKLKMINKDYLHSQWGQTLIDVGWWKINGKASGDMDFNDVKDDVFAITPVPGGVWPVTVSCIFANLIDMIEMFG